MASLMEDIVNARPTIWINPNRVHDQWELEAHLQTLPLKLGDMEAAERRWTRLRPVLSHLFPEETRNPPHGPPGSISSALRPVTEAYACRLGLGLVGLKPATAAAAAAAAAPPPLFIKEDSHLPVCGSVKARGGLFETFAFAEDAAAIAQPGVPLLDALLRLKADRWAGGAAAPPSSLVGSTDNLGLSVGRVTKPRAETGTLMD